MKFLGKIILSIVGNALGILTASYLIKDFIFTGDFKQLVIAALIVTGINVFLRPVMKLVFGPLIVLTLGLFVIVLNALTIYLLDFFMESITINGLVPLFFATLLIGVINFFINFSVRALKTE